MVPPERPPVPPRAGRGASRGIRPARPADMNELVRLRCALWPREVEKEHAEEVARFFAGERPRGPWEMLVAETASGALLGFAEVSLRPCAEGCATSPVAYLEGWFVEAGAREQGVGRALVQAVADWGRARGCRELGSDADASNERSRAAHLALGFADVALVRCFRRAL